MRTMTAYFAGVGTVAVAVAAGLGGGLLFANIVAPHQPKYATEPTKLEQRMAARTIPVTSAPSEPVPYLAATQAANPAAAPQTETATPPVEQKAEAEPKPPEPKTASNNVAAEQVTPPPAAPAQPSAHEPAASPREAFAKARDSDLKARDGDMKARDSDMKTRDGDSKRAAAEKRRAERRQQWADKRRIRQPREQELEAVEQSVREDTEPRQAFMAEPARLDTPRLEMPRIKLFGDD